MSEEFGSEVCLEGNMSEQSALRDFLLRFRFPPFKSEIHNPRLTALPVAYTDGRRTPP